MLEGPDAVNGGRSSRSLEPRHGSNQGELSPEEVIEDLFTYHPPTSEQAEKYKRINEAGKAFALVVYNECPSSPDRTTAIRQIREARMTANASIATKTGGLIR